MGSTTSGGPTGTVRQRDLAFSCRPPHFHPSPSPTQKDSMQEMVPLKKSLPQEVPPLAQGTFCPALQGGAPHHPSQGGRAQTEQLTFMPCLAPHACCQGWWWARGGEVMNAGGRGRASVTAPCNFAQLQTVLILAPTPTAPLRFLCGGTDVSCSVGNALSSS